jgi:predicted flap endonuclease-1-like 5' DNA nuclease
MAQKRFYVRDSLFYGLMAFILAGTFGLGIAFAIAEVYGSGWLSGIAVGGVVALIGGLILAFSASKADLPPPNTLKAPVAPPGGAFRAPAAAARSAAAPQPAKAAPAAEPSKIETVAEKAGYAASAAVTSAAKAAREAMSDVAELAGISSSKDAPAIEAVKPAALAAPRDGGPDDLKKIKGVGPKLEELLHSLGYYHFDQIANWTDAEIAWVDSNLEGFNGRATRDEWVAQAKLLAAGGETEFSERVDKGDVY